MSQGEGNILLYGATGFNGRLIAAEGAREMARTGSKIRLTLAARDGDNLRKVAEKDKKNKMDFRVFSLESHSEIMKGLDGFQRGDQRGRTVLVDRERVGGRRSRGALPLCRH